MSDFLSNYGLWLAVVGGITVLGIIATVINAKNRKNKAAKFLEEHPNAARIFLQTKASITSEQISVFSVNDEVPVMFTEKMKPGFYVIPGKNIKLQVNYTYTRPGVIYKSISESTEVVDITIDVEANKNYKITFDRKKSEFSLEEL